MWLRADEHLRKSYPVFKIGDDKNKISHLFSRCVSGIDVLVMVHHGDVVARIVGVVLKLILV